MQVSDFPESETSEEMKPGSEIKQRRITRKLAKELREQGEEPLLLDETAATASAAAGGDAKGHAKAKGENWLKLPPTVTYEDAPAYMQDNEMIKAGYRVNYSWRECLLSFFTQHNEMGNMWTHGVGIVIFILYFVGTAVWALAPETVAPRPDLTNVAFFFVYYSCAFFCMLTSTMYHTFCSHSEDSMLFFIRCDLSGIAALVAGSYLSPFYNIFYCRPWLQVIYLSVTIVFAVAGVAGPQVPGFHSTAMRGVRAAVYGGMAGFGVLPIIHSAFVLHWDDFVGFFVGVILMYACYGVGLIFYITRWPESRWPGKFDIWFNSHSLWHVFVLLGAIVHAYGCWSLYLMRLNRQCPLEE